MPSRAPLSAGELDQELDALHPTTASDLRDLHGLLLRAELPRAELPRATLVRVAGLIAELPSSVLAAVGPRPRTVFRLLQAGAVEAASAVLVDNALATPLRTRIEPPKVFVELPGFRDPRFGAADDCYDITASVTLRHHLDEVCIGGGVASFGGWASLDPIVTAPSEQVRLIASNGDVEVAVGGRRLRRPDLLAGKGQAAERRAWAGWSAELDLDDPQLIAGEWALSVEIDHDGYSGSAPLGGEVGDLAQAASDGAMAVGGRTIRWTTAAGRGRLYIG